MGLKIEVRNGNVEQAMRVLKRKLMKDGIMKELRQFAKRLRVLSEEYSFIILINYTAKLDLQIKKFDGDNLSYTVKDFPNIRHALEQLIVN